MLYVTTRNKRDAYTAQRVVRNNRGPDGGLFLPMRPPAFTQADIASLGDKSFGQNVADILNVLFQTKLSSWDVDFSIGRYPVRLNSLNHRIFTAETWHNPQWSYDQLVSNLISLVSDETVVPGNWGRIAVRIALLFGIYGELRRKGIDTMDVSVVSGDFSAPISAWYAKKWGLPIEKIICCCNENNALWDLICHGQLRTEALSIATILPEADIVVPENLERLVLEVGGSEEVTRYLDICRQGKMYCPTDNALSVMRRNLYASVVSSSRLSTTIPGVYRTNRYLMSLACGLAYAGLLDYRAKTGQTRCAVVLSETCPEQDGAILAQMMNIPQSQLVQLISET